MPRKTALAVASTLLVISLAFNQDRADLAAIWKIKDEGLNRSHIMEVISYLTDVYGPRLAGSSNLRNAEDWVQKKFKEWGLENVHTEKYEFGRSWELKKFEAHMIEPTYSPLIAYPKAWTPGTNGALQAEAVRVDIGSEADFAKYRGKLQGMFVLTQPPREVAAHFTPEGNRFTEDTLAQLSRMPEPAERRPADRRGGGRELQRKIMDFYVSEGVAALIDPAQGDGGSMFIAGGGERSANAPPVPPQVTMAVEHYNRICRILEKNMKVKLEVAIEANYTTADSDDYNVLAEVPGTDKKDELVMLGAHIDSWHSGTGATDNAAGVAVAMEAIRILKASGLKPRRTVRIALWSGEEEGLLGSRAYVADHFAKRPATTTEVESNSGQGGKTLQNPPELKPEHGRLSAYFNLDNGTGKIRGIYLQGNEEVRPIFEAWLAPFKDMGATTVSIRNTGNTDHVPFDAVGLPAFQFIQDPIEYESRTHHSNMDVYDRVQRADVVQAAVIMASFVYHTAMRDEKLPRKPLVTAPNVLKSGSHNPGP